MHHYWTDKFTASIDNLIAVETEKMALLNNLKKGLMQQLFPREGESVPRLRFLEFLESGYPSVKEQQKIADCLSSIDDLINIQNQKIETLNKIKPELLKLYLSKTQNV